MTEYVWDKFLTERDRAVFAAGGFGARADLGKRPALLVPVIYTTGEYRDDNWDCWKLVLEEPPPG